MCKVCRSLFVLMSFTNKTISYNITEILLKVALNTITLINKSPLHLCPEVQCSTDCKYGYEHDIQGCSTCKCKPLRKYYLIFIDVEYSMQTFTYVILIRVMVFSATFNNSISCSYPYLQSVLHCTSGQRCNGDLKSEIKTVNLTFKLYLDSIFCFLKS
jgi:hypothetical protein